MVRTNLKRLVRTSCHPKWKQCYDFIQRFIGTTIAILPHKGWINY